MNRNASRAVLISFSIMSWEFLSYVSLVIELKIFVKS